MVKFQHSYNPGQNYLRKFSHHVHFPTQRNYFLNASLRKENPFPQFNVASRKRSGIRLSFEYTTTLLSGEGGEGRTGIATMFRKMLSKYTIFSTVFSKIVAIEIKAFYDQNEFFFLRLPRQPYQKHAADWRS